jgi:hypothetical protein
MANLVHNERVKLVATLSNNISVASLVGGVALPAWSKPMTGGFVDNFLFLMGGVMLCMVFHYYGSWHLRWLRE